MMDLTAIGSVTIWELRIMRVVGGGEAVELEGKAEGIFKTCGMVRRMKIKKRKRTRFK